MVAIFSQGKSSNCESNEHILSKFHFEKALCMKKFNQFHFSWSKAKCNHPTLWKSTTGFVSHGERSSTKKNQLGRLRTSSTPLMLQVAGQSLSFSTIVQPRRGSTTQARRSFGLRRKTERGGKVQGYPLPYGPASASHLAFQGCGGTANGV